jgi:hypothetical protein
MVKAAIRFIALSEKPYCQCYRPATRLGWKYMHTCLSSPLALISRNSTWTCTAKGFNASMWNWGMSYLWLYKPFSSIQSFQESPTEESRIAKGGIWHDLPDIGCSTQVIVMHEERHMIVTAGTGEKKARGRQAQLSHLGRQDPSTTLSNSRKGQSTSHLHGCQYFSTPGTNLS